MSTAGSSAPTDSNSSRLVPGPKPWTSASSSPPAASRTSLGTGDVGYVATGLKDTHDLPAGDTVAPQGADAIQPLPGYRQPKPLVFAGLYGTNPEAYADLRDALERLRLSDPALTFQPEKSLALGFGFRAGFLGVLHMDIVRERLEREFDIELVITPPPRSSTKSKPATAP